MTATPRSRLTVRDALRLSYATMRARRLRAYLSMLGIAIGIAAIVAVVGVSQSSSAALLAQLGSLGNLLTVAPTAGISGQGQLPAEAPAMLSRIAAVQAVASLGAVPNVTVRRTDRIDPLNTGGILVVAASVGLPATVGAGIARGTFLNAATARYPTVVLGDQAARALGVATTGPGTQVYLGGHWFTVIGILTPAPLSPEIDRAALVGDPVARTLLGFDGHPTAIYLRAQPDHVGQVRALLARTANPASPDQVQVSRPSDVLTARLATRAAATTTLLGLGAVALLIGGVGVANTMVISVLERRADIGLHRALGATRRHVAARFLTESLILTTAGGFVGVLAAAGLTAGYATSQHWQVAIPPAAPAGGLAAALIIGTMAGLYPALRAARVSPTEALRAT